MTQHLIYQCSDAALYSNDPVLKWVGDTLESNVYSASKGTVTRTADDTLTHGDDLDSNSCQISVLTPSAAWELCH